MKTYQQKNLTGKQAKEQARQEFHKKTIGAYVTYALSDEHSRERETNIAIPSEEAVERAKHWVDENHK